MRNLGNLAHGAPATLAKAPAMVGTVAVLLIVVLAVVLSSCVNMTSQGGPVIGVLLPATGNARYGRFDQPLIEQRIKQRCPDCRVQAVSAEGDTAIQQQQIDTMITNKVTVMILSAVDAAALRSSVLAAHQAGIPVIAYDRLAEGPISGYVTFNGAEVGKLQGEGLLQGMGAKAHGGQIVMMNGAAVDPNSAWFKQGALSVLQGRVTIGRSYDTVDWQQSNAYTNMTAAIAALGPTDINGVLAANDNLATGVIDALKAAGVSALPPITGQDADLDAIQRIVGGEQYMTVYKPFKTEAYAAADMAVGLLHGHVGSAPTADDATAGGFVPQHIPTVLLTPISVMAGNIKDTIVKDGVYTVGEICIPGLRADCARIGLLP